MSALEELQELYSIAAETERISLRGRELEHVDAELAYIQLHFPNIRHLDLSENALEWLPADFGLVLPKLVALDVTKNRFRSVADLGDVLQKCASLKSLSVTLKNATEEKLLLVMLPKLRILNGTPLSSPASPPPPPLSLTTAPASESPMKAAHALSTVLLSPSTASNSSVGGGDKSPSERTTLVPSHSPSPPSPPKALVPTISSPQDKRTLRLQFANLKLERDAVESERQRETASASAAQNALDGTRKRRGTGATGHTKSSSVRPTETPASISDDKTDWRKLLKSQTSSQATEWVTASAPAPAPLSAAVSHVGAALELPVSTETFLAQLKAIVKTFHECASKTSAPSPHAQGSNGSSDTTKQTQLMVYEQLDRHVDQLARKLSRQERDAAQQQQQTPDTSAIAPMKHRIAMLQTRWNLLEVCGMYGVEKARDVDPTLGQAFAQLLEMQQHVLVALQHQQVAAAATAQQLLTNSSNRDNGGAPSPQHEAQMRVLLEVAESLESDLEAAQTRLQQEQAQRALLEQENRSLKRENDAIKRQPRPGASATNSATSAGHASRGVLTAALSSERTSPTPFEEPRDTGVSSRQRIRKRTGTRASATETSSSSYAALKKASSLHRSSSSPDRTSAHPSAGAVSESPPPAKAATRVRNLTLKQLVDLIQCITASKAKADTRAFDSASGAGAPRETMEQHMYAYLNQRFGLHVLTIDYASAIWKSCDAFAAQANDAAVFRALLRNELDEGFLAIKRKLQQALVDLLRAYFQAKHPLKQELAIAALVQNRIAHAIYEDEWRELLTYLYDPQDVRHACLCASGCGAGLTREWLCLSLLVHRARRCCAS